MLQWAPAFYLAFGYWMASSIQLMENEHLTVLEQASDVMPSQHVFWSVFTIHGWEAPKWPMIGSFFVLLALFALQKRILPKFNFCRV